MVHKLKTRDIATKVVSSCGKLRFSITNTRHIATNTIHTHKLVPRTYGNVPFLQLVGGNVTFASLLASMLQSEERVESRLVTPAATAVSEASALGECRSYVSNPVPGVLPNTLRVQRVLYEQSTPHVSATTAQWDGDLALSLDPTNTLDSTAAAELMNSHMTLHAANFWRKSEGSNAAVLAKCNVRVNEADESFQDWAVTESCGLIAQSIVDEDGRFDEHLAALQLGLLHASTSQHELWRQTMLRSREEQQDTVVQDLLSLATGDYEGAFAVATKLRQVTADIDQERTALEPLRAAFKLSSQPICRLDLNSVERTPLDSFCRCSKADFLKALAAASNEARQQALAEPVACTYCRKTFTITADDLKTLSC